MTTKTPQKTYFTYPAHPHDIVLPNLIIAQHNTARIQSMSAAPKLNDSMAIPQQAQKFMTIADAHQAYLLQQHRAQQHFMRIQNQLFDTLCTEQALPPTQPAPMKKSPATKVVHFDASAKQASTEKTPKKPAVLFNRQDLEKLAAGKISDLFGPLFAAQDNYFRQVRMPEPPLLLTDRIIKIDAEPASMKTGSIYTETDVTENAWYLQDGRMPAGITIESGQADLLLISWLGVNLENKGERVYRLLGCELTYHSELPKVGDSLHFDIHLEGYAKQDDILLFFFKSNCRINGELCLTVRHGQAGFFTDAELAESSGVLWDAETADYVATPKLATPILTPQTKQFNKQQLLALSKGDVVTCMGEDYAYTQTHTQTPRTHYNQLQLIDEITEFDFNGGPKKRGYLRAVQNLTPEHWSFQGHFKNDPCVPGTLMLEAGLDIFAFYLIACGFSLDKDGWRFEPVKDQNYKLLCRGQASPQSKQVVYELYVDELIAAPHPTLHAHLMVSVDGLKSFYTYFSVNLIPDLPFENQTKFLATYQEPKPVAKLNDFKFDFRSLIACAWGRPEQAFGPAFHKYNPNKPFVHLPSPPYHFMSRVLEINGEVKKPKIGSKVIVEYDIEPDAWFFTESKTQEMPFCVLMEVALQPCGWLAVFVSGDALEDNELCFRNLDGDGCLHHPVTTQTKTVITEVTLTKHAAFNDTIIVAFDVNCKNQDMQEIFSLKTVFGFFSTAAFANQVGTPITDQEKNTALEKASNYHLDLSQRPANYFNQSLCLPEKKLQLLTRITGYWKDGGQEKLGLLRAEKDVHPSDWYFKSHFYQDPVQPGSIGVEAMLELLKFYMIDTGTEFNDACFSTPKAHDLQWTYRGQVIPKDKKIIIVLEITQHNKTKTEYCVTANSQLWVNNICIYKAENLSLKATKDISKKIFIYNETISQTTHPWITDHCPTFTLPAVPIMHLPAKLMALMKNKHPNRKLVSIKNIALNQWLVINPELNLRYRIEEESTNHYKAKISQIIHSKEKQIATAKIELADQYPSFTQKPFEIAELKGIESPYKEADLFHGESFQLIRSMSFSRHGACANIDLTEPNAQVYTILLDNFIHPIPHAKLFRWNNNTPADFVAYPAIIESLNFYNDLPKSGELTIHVIPDGFYHDNNYPRFLIQVTQNNKPLLEIKLIEKLFRIHGRLGNAPQSQRKKFIKDKKYIPGLHISTIKKSTTEISLADVKQNDYLPGTIAHIYNINSTDLMNIARQVAIKDHLSHQFKIHPSHFKILESDKVLCEKSGVYYHMTVCSTKEGFRVSSNDLD
ncbi:MAG: polyketide synthase dehydratase domain-containing protein [Gammaproteobacteria bacterium]|nr:polyketide synthase dehydratase domain-containing protein [Gammaproteobacteria bacterium]